MLTQELPFKTNKLGFSCQKKLGLGLAFDFFLLLLQTESLCGTLCNRTVYYNRNNFISEFVMGNERKVFGDGYCVVWAFYSSMYVFEKVEHYSFNFDNIIYATGGNMGLFLGWSLKSIFIEFIEFLNQNLKKNTQT